MKQNQLRQLTEISLFAALICVVVFFIRIPFGSQFVHLGNALVGSRSIDLWCQKRGAGSFTRSRHL